VTTPGTPPLVFLTGCACNGYGGCGGHIRLNADEPVPPLAQHTYTAACDGLHPAGPCPAYEKPLEFRPAQGGDAP
jgi:hypothetical protein